MKSKTPYFLLLIVAILYNIWLMGKAGKEKENQNEMSKTEISITPKKQTQP